MPTAQVPLTFPTGMQRGALNGQGANAAPIERLERAVYHLLGARRLMFPGSSFPRTYLNVTTVTIYTKVLRAAHTLGARLYLQYATVSPLHNFKLTLNGAVTTPSIVLPGTAAGLSGALGVNGSREASLGFTLGTNVDSERGIVDLEIVIDFAWADEVALLINPDIRIYSWQVVPDDVASVTGS